MDVCVVFVVRTVASNVKWHEGRKDLNSTKMDQRGKTTDRQKKKKIPGQSMWDLWWTKWHWDRFFPEYFGYPLSI
jgi:hypothetical protein